LVALCQQPGIPQIWLSGMGLDVQDGDISGRQIVRQLRSIYRAIDEPATVNPNPWPEWKAVSPAAGVR
jgi:hypothetical protein